MTNSKPRPNVVLIVVDQMRADALGINQGLIFFSQPQPRYAWPARANCQCLFTGAVLCAGPRGPLNGLGPGHLGRVGYTNALELHPDPAQTFRDAGYQTQCIGKMHVYPARKRLVLTMTLHDGYLCVDRHHDGAYGLFETVQ